MATDKTEPKIVLILKIALTAIGVFIATRVGLVAYFDKMNDEEQFEKVGSQKNQALTDLRTYEKDMLATGPMPIDKSMQMIAEKGRMASEEIQPKPSDDTAPLECWKMMPCTAPVFGKDAGGPATAPTVAATVSDGGPAAPPASTADAGAGGGHP
jgi:hypothetical protein